MVQAGEKNNVLIFTIIFLLFLAIVAYGEQNWVDRSLLIPVETLIKPDIKQMRRDYYCILIPNPDNPKYYKPDNRATEFQVSQIIPPFVIFTYDPLEWVSFSRRGTRGSRAGKYIRNPSKRRTIAIKMDGAKVHRGEWIGDALKRTFGADETDSNNFFTFLGIINAKDLNGFPMTIPAFFPVKSSSFRLGSCM